VNDAYYLRVLVSFDAALRSLFRFGKPYVTLSSWIGTGAAHGHRWAEIASWCLDHMAWCGFGPGHCRDAICNDILRNREAIIELTDPVVVAYYARKS